MTACIACATELQAKAKFCFECGAPVAADLHRPAEYKQVTVLFADVVHSMDLAAAVGAERLREIMAELFDRCAAVVQRYGGVVEKFIGDAVMAVFGAPVALEDHALRGCLAALEIQQQAQPLAAEVARADGLSLALRVGLNSGEVVAGELGSAVHSYTAIGEQVGLAQRMESVAPPGGVMLSESTARLVQHVAALGEPELVRIKGAAEPVSVRRLLGVSPELRHTPRPDSTLVGRSWEVGALRGILDESIAGTGCVVGVTGPPGIGKSRIVREVSALARSRGVEVFAAYCESHAREIPFYTATSLLRTVLGIEHLDDESARARIEERAPDADPEDLLLLEDLLGIRGSGVALPAIDPDARRRRVTRLVNAVSLARTTPAVYVVEDAHWIDEVSDALLADLLGVTRQTPSLVLITYRPEYHGALASVASSQTIHLGPLNSSQTAVLAAELIGSDPSAAALCGRVADRAAGNPLFAEEMVRDLAERGVLTGSPGRYACMVGDAELVVPATVQATIASRIDRLDPAVKRTLQTAAVIGLRFDAAQLASLDGEAQIAPLLAAELVDQVRFSPQAEYAFHHPLIRIVAYESQLKSQRATLHRRLASAIEQSHPDALDENAAMIAEHLEAADDLHAAFGWHMRAGAWAQHRDIRAARVSWERARAVADRLPVNDPDRSSMRISPRTLLCGSTSWVSGTVADTGFDELRELCTASGDQVSLAIGMAGLMTALIFHSRYIDASRVASDCVRLLESIGDPMLMVALAIAPGNIKVQAGEALECLRLAERIIELADGDPTKGNLLIGSPLVIALMFRGSCRYCLGLPDWKEDLDEATKMAHDVDVRTFVSAVLAKYGFAVHSRVLLPDAAADRDTAEALAMAEHSGDDYAVDTALLTRGLVLVHQDGPQREAGMALLAQYRDAYRRHGYVQGSVRFFDTELAREKARIGDFDGAIQTARAAVDYLFDVGDMIARGEAVRVFVESLLQRATAADLAEAQAAIDRLAAVPTDPGYALLEIPLLRMRALLARAKGDEVGYRDLAHRYRMRATEVGYEGHIAMAEDMM
ncbi:ATP-binding protein [Mycolicibacter longobardus]|uniref:Cyclase n=1 Tax=Mycolicibacter longobardus TaxID=1108812 RepID=A0A1X1YDU1_9MYCO|nr:adenylate/guanylate cyclase domain-containing protein [Mycolicibacter longobardus]MCV7382387.1 AAA family ATPase [Mycolicibacter longobardus]ORW09236.1 cyclase [Mycolicibacter longobardus]